MTILAGRPEPGAQEATGLMDSASGTNVRRRLFSFAKHEGFITVGMVGSAGSTLRCEWGGPPLLGLYAHTVIVVYDRRQLR